MSPASSGALEVERYIGAYLISSQSRSKGNLTKSNGRDQFYHREEFVPRYLNNNHPQRCRSVEGWAGGIPLISFANYQRRGNKTPQFMRVQDSGYPLSHLAVHTQGAPLILTNKYNHRKNKSATIEKNYLKTRGPSANFKSKDNSTIGVDAVSVNSDESSASTNSENCLPRIIKPRKRRKKDRKPAHLICPIGTEDCFSTDSGSPDINTPETQMINSHLPFIFSHLRVSDDSNLPLYDSINRVNAHNDVQETPKLHHNFEDVEELSKDINDNQQASLCQCRYCDPSGQIWDVERHCYSPFLTTPKRQSDFNFPDIQETTSINVLHLPISSDISECNPGLCLKEEQIESNTFALGSSRDLEVSTEIVTSLNGHRDLEIKFFSTPSNLENAN